MENFSRNSADKLKEANKEKLPFLSRFGRLRGVRELTAAMAFFAAMSGKTVPAEHGIQSPKEASNVGLTLKKKEVAKQETKPEFGFYHRFTKEEDGKLKFNPWAFIAPLQAELGYSVKRQEQVAFDVPYEYSRFFDSAKSLNPEDKERVVEYLEDRVKQREKNIYYLGENEFDKIDCSSQCEIIPVESKPDIYAALKQKIPNLRLDASPGFIMLKNQ